ncbi:MAG: sugar phosphate isomerase/epimerase [Synergistaceae bacterium]|jgi:sugar phosphate isomerase/epimerase|nr:sugar phosphate isomerase/epimerase [Synergistaceae bacterium]
MERIIAVNSNCYHKYPIEDAIEGIARAGFRYVELTATKGWTEHVFPSMDFSYLCSVRRRLKDAGLASFAMSGHTNLMDPARAGDFLDIIQLSAFFGCGYIVSSVGEAHLADRASASDEEAAARISALLPCLREYGLALALEIHGEHGSGRRMSGIVDMVGSPLVKINYDTANAIFYGGVDLADDIDACAGRIGFMHLKDKAGERKEWNFPALGRGCVDFPMIFKKLEEHGNRCPLSIEIEFGPDGSRDIGEADEAVRCSREYLESVGMAV